MALLERPNPRQSWPGLMTQAVAQLLLAGNAVIALGPTTVAASRA
jgi:phage portal protein BeeE